MPILTDIREEIKSMIGGMRVADGFNFDWESVNPSFFSMANTGQIATEPGKPVCIVEDLEEENKDSLNAVNGGMYVNDVNFLISFVVRPDIAEGEKFIDNVDSALDLGVEDLKRLFGNSPCLNGKAFNNLYSGYKKLFSGQEDLPAWCEIKLLVRYRQDRRNPEVAT